MKRYPGVIQIRNGSSRFPGKAMAQVLGRPMIDYLVERVRAVRSVGRIVIATSEAPTDDSIESYGRSAHVDVFRGNEKDVLSRIVHAVRNLPGETFIKFWGDSPLIDPRICEEIIRRFEQDFPDCDLVSNNHPSTYPEGMQIEVIRKSTLEELHSRSLSKLEREHVTTALWQHPDEFRLGNVEHEPDIHDAYRICLDYREDFDQIRAVIEALYPSNPLFGMEEIVSFLDDHPSVKAINQEHYESREAYLKRIVHEDRE